MSDSRVTRCGAARMASKRPSFSSRGTNFRASSKRFILWFTYSLPDTQINMLRVGYGAYGTTATVVDTGILTMEETTMAVSSTAAAGDANLG
eukprot:scaffold118_cov185-Amphora_coffeaeformis.AAC.3